MSLCYIVVFMLSKNTYTEDIYCISRIILYLKNVGGLTSEFIFCIHVVEDFFNFIRSFLKMFHYHVTYITIWELQIPPTLLLTALRIQRIIDPRNSHQECVLVTDLFWVRIENRRQDSSKNLRITSQSHHRKNVKVCYHIVHSIEQITLLPHPCHHHPISLEHTSVPTRALDPPTRSTRTRNYVLFLMETNESDLIAGDDQIWGQESCHSHIQCLPKVRDHPLRTISCALSDYWHASSFCSRHAIAQPLETHSPRPANVRTMIFVDQFSMKGRWLMRSIPVKTAGSSIRGKPIAIGGENTTDIGHESSAAINLMLIMTIDQMLMQHAGAQEVDMIEK